ncbi:hypothetical protein LTR09_000392 [Extremus antarcticus]|uniref:Protein kinase domain-containing protein n=1 Tax=Extremus antarcticus TaxID=702011 RepID=A0AAJ0LXA3_9PEZI|nr:hypothetical protein LTR09_000392 [Extremus antarcticus]
MGSFGTNTTPYRKTARNHFRESHIEIRYLASGSNGETYLAIATKDFDQAHEAYKEHGCMDTLVRQLRQSLVVAKFLHPRGPADGNDLQNEINVLKMLGTRPNITNLVDYHVDGDSQWFTMEYVPEGSLRHFVKACYSKIDLGMQWGIALQIVETFLYLHFGITDSKTMTPLNKSWGLWRYADVHCGNMLLRYSDSDTGPEVRIVLADFGRMRECTIEEDEFKYIHPDCEECLRVTRRYGLLPKLTEAETPLWEWAEKLNKYQFEGDFQLLEFLNEFLEVARKEQGRHKKHMPYMISEYLRCQPPTNNDMLRLVGQHRY